MRAYLKNFRQAPRKVRLIANAVRGKNVEQALAELSLMPHKSSAMFSKLLNSAVANARQQDTSVSAGTLTIDTVTVDKGISYTRYRPRAFGRAAPINRECAHVTVSLKSTAPVAGKKVVEKPVSTKTTAKKAVKKVASK